MQKYIFVDFDGVLVSERYHAAVLSTGKVPSDLYGPLFDPEAVENLRMIIDATGAGVIISSTWKFEGETRMKGLWDKRKMPGNLLGSTPDTALDIDILSMDLDDPNTFANLAGKGSEVKAWLKQNAPKDPSKYRYVILDDMTDFLPEQKDNFIPVSPRVGITMKDAVKAIEILSR